MIFNFLFFSLFLLLPPLQNQNTELQKKFDGWKNREEERGEGGEEGRVRKGRGRDILIP